MALSLATCIKTATCSDLKNHYIAMDNVAIRAYQSSMYFLHLYFDERLS